ncbi:MAG: SH3 domain-containing protein [Bellilinea sp.]
MRKRAAHIAVYSIIITIFLSLGLLAIRPVGVHAQIPTGSVPTVTGTPSGVMATVKAGLGEDTINVRSGPHALYYPKIGVLMVGQSIPALGRSTGSDWILISYPGVPGGQGWVFSKYVDLSPGDLPVVQPPASPTPEVTQTINPTLAAQFIVTVAPTRLPTFTQAPPLTIPTYETSGGGQALTGIPMGLVILILLSVGILMGIFSFIQRR